MKIIMFLLILNGPLFACGHCDKKCVPIRKMEKLRDYYAQIALEFFDNDDYKEFTYTTGKVNGIQECIEMND